MDSHQETGLSQPADNNTQNVTPLGSMNWKKIGNKHFAHKRYNDAIMAYTNGIDAGNNSINMLANRSSAYLRLSKFKSSLADAEAALMINSSHIKSMYRKVKSLFGLEMYKDGLAFLENIEIDSMPQNDAQIIHDLVAKGKRYLSQSENGDYQWDHIYEGQSVYHDMANYTKAVVVKETSTKGRGVFATKMIKAGELVLASKAFAYIEDYNRCDRSCSLLYVDGSVPEIYRNLIEKISDVLLAHPEKSQTLATLFAGPELGSLKCDEADNFVDMKRIEHITLYNAISTNQRIDGSFCRNAGLWIIPSFMNHSCVDANSTWKVIGDFSFIRAFKDISEGDEIEVCYKAPTRLIAQEGLDMYDFDCQCRLCKRDRLDNLSVKADRASLLSKLQSLLSKFDDTDNDFRQQDDEEISSIFTLFEQSREDAPELNLCLINELIDFGKLRFESNSFMKGVETFEKIHDLTKNVASFTLASIVACIYIILSYAKVNEKHIAKNWIETLKKETLLSFGTLHILHVQFLSYIKEMREYNLDI